MRETSSIPPPSTKFHFLWRGLQESSYWNSDMQSPHLPLTSDPWHPALLIHSHCCPEVLTLALLTLGAGSVFQVAVLCILGCLAAILASTYQMPSNNPKCPPKVQNCPQLRTTALAGDACELRVLFACSLCLFSVFLPVECKFRESGDFLLFSLMYLKCLKQCLSHSWNVKFGQCWDNMGNVKTTWAMESTGLGSVPNQVTD